MSGSLPNKDSKFAISGGVAGVGLGTALIALSPFISKDPNIVKYLQMLSPSISVVGAYILKAILLQIQMQYNLWLSKQIRKEINNNLLQSGITETHIINLIKQREKVESIIIKQMQDRLFNNEISPSSLSNSSRDVTNAENLGSGVERSEDF